MNKFKKFIQVISSLTLVFGVIAFIYYMTIQIWNAFSSLNDNLSATIITATSTFLIASITIILGKHYERKQLIEKEMRNEKLPVYNEFIEFLFKILNNNNSKNR